MPTSNNARGLFSLFVDVESGSTDADIPAIYNYHEALKAAQALDRKYHHKRSVCLSEFGIFKSNGKEREEFLEVWWNSSWEDTREPKSRGYGFYVPEVGRKRWVEYAPALTAGPPDEEFEPENIHRIFEPAGSFSLKSSIDGGEPVWEDFSDYDAVLAEAKQLSLDSTKSVSIYEYGRFDIEGDPKNELIEFWWDDAQSETNCSPPKARGIGLVYKEDGTPVLLAYTPSSIGEDNEESEQDEPEEIDAEIDDSEYVKTHCEDCGKIMPLYEKFEYQVEEEVGRSSGSARFGSSSRRRVSSGGRSSHSSGSSSSYATGRTYYATRTLILCEDCFDVRVEADKWTFGDWAVVIGGAAFLMGGAAFLWMHFH